MSHSKRNTSLAFFTSHERQSLKTHWGSQSTRLTRDSFLPFGSCQLCLLPSVDPVCCPSGDLFCRECAMTNLLAQRKELKRLEKLAEKQREEEELVKEREDEDIRRRIEDEFERVQMGLEARRAPTENGSSDPKTEQERGTKRKFEIDEDELRRIAQSERTKARLDLANEKEAGKKHLPSFWVPTEAPEMSPTTTSTSSTAAAKSKQPTCPCSSASSPHSLTLKTLTTLHFTSEPNPTSKTPTLTCPSCKKALSNATKAVAATPCGHVLCKPCVDKFMKPELRHHRDAHDEGDEPSSVHCFVCDAEVGGKEGKGKGKKDKEGKKMKEARGGLVEIRSEGTGFAGGGKNVVKRSGVAFTV